MKKIYFLAACILFPIGIIFPQDFTGIKICINPGHGGHDSNDRYIAETGFWESDGNLAKGLYLKKILEGFNAEIVMTRETNTTADDLPLSQIVAIANSNNVDYFHAIHSNAYNAQSNYTLLLFQGRDNAPTYPGALTMGNYIANEIYTAHRTTAKYNRGDFDFYGTGQPYLGVFKGLNMPGTLSEGSFHDYIPESYRLLNSAYTKHEAWAITKGFISYFNLLPITTGMIAGIVRDPEQTVTYYAIASKGDNIKPLNKVKVTLTPGNKVYTGDSNNNGFFLFDSLQPGQYKLVYECENYFKDSSTVNVTANNTAFADKYLQYDTTIAPLILSHYPQNTTDSTAASTVIKVSFNRTMNRESVENSFSITPAAQGKFSWEDNDKTVVFTPAIPLEKSSNYTVVISKSAKSKWLVPISADYTFNFITKNRNRLKLLSSYPSNNQDELSGSLQIRLTFDAPVYNGSLSGQINLYDKSNMRLSVKNVKIFAAGNNGCIYFEPLNSLPPSENYKIVLGGGIADYDDIPLVDQIEINFKTSGLQNNFGTIVNDFESASEWNMTSSGTNAAATVFTAATEQKVNGSKSGKLAYQFSGASGGEIKLANQKEINFVPENDLNIGLWVFGDLSFNKIYCSFGIDSSLNQSIYIDSLNWTGWKLLQVKMQSISSAANKIFYSMSVLQNTNGASSGTLYLDDFQFGKPVTAVDEGTRQVNNYSLFQNYPNPFNPSTTIKFQVPERAFVTLKVYDILGREVSTLVNEEKERGIYSVEFSSGALNQRASGGASNQYGFSSGVYFYTLKAGSFISTKKFILLK